MQDCVGGEAERYEYAGKQARPGLGEEEESRQERECARYDTSTVQHFGEEKLL